MSSVQKVITVPEFQNATITDEMIQTARDLIGVWLRRDIHWPVTYEPICQHDIRRWAMYAVGDENPLWCEADYAKKTPWGRTIASPTFPYSVDTTLVAPGLPGVQWIMGGTRWEFFKPIYVGDLITARARLIDVKDKMGTRVPRFVIQTGEVIYANQTGQLVARAETDILRIPRARSGQGFRYEDKKTRGRATYTAEEIDEIRRAVINEERRGAEIRYWEDVSVGDALPAVTKGPLTLVDILAFYVGRRSTYPPLRLAFLERERHPKNVYFSPQTGIPVHPAAGHFDVEIAHEIGMPDAYDAGYMRVNWMGHLVTNWMSDWGFVRKLNAKLPIPFLAGDTLHFKGKVTRKYAENGEHLVDITCWGDNQRGERQVEGGAVVRLPSHDPADKMLFTTAGA